MDEDSLRYSTGNHFGVGTCAQPKIEQSVHVDSSAFLVIFRYCLQNIPRAIPGVAFLKVVVVVPNNRAIRVRNDRLLRIRIKRCVQNELCATRRNDWFVPNQKLRGYVVMIEECNRVLQGSSPCQET